LKKFECALEFDLRCLKNIFWTLCCVLGFERIGGYCGAFGACGCLGSTLPQFYLLTHLEKGGKTLNKNVVNAEKAVSACAEMAQPAAPVS
jgi:hypothetical protein